MSRCPSDEIFVAFLERRLSSEEARTLETHLTSCETCRAVVADLHQPQVPSIAVAETWSPARAKGEADALARAVGTRARGASLGRYLTLSLLGRGGMGEVYAAYDPELDRRVAIKVLRTAQEPEAAKKRLLREAWALARLSHPNVVHVYDAGEHEGDVFIAMELVEGESLDVWCARSARPGWADVLTAYLGAARGLAAAHEKGLIHRDVKPSNILRGKDGRVRIADFGLVSGEDAPRSARASEPAPPPSTLTRTGALLGTPLYMAPEQLDEGATSAASDQYSLCAALYEGLYAALPLSVARDAPLLALAEAKRGGPPAAPPPGSEVPAAVFTAVVRGLSPKPEARYPSLADLVVALTHATTPPRRLARRVVAATLAGTVILGAAAIGLVKSGAFANPCEKPERALAGVWDEAAKTRVREALIETGRPYAEDTATRVETILDRQAGEYTAMHGEVCEVGRAGRQSRAIVALREACLERRLGQLKALVTVLGEKPDPKVLDRAVQAAGELAPVTYCADVEALTSRVQPPEDAKLRERVAALQPEVDRLETLFNTGQYKDGIEAGERLTGPLTDVPYPPLAAAAKFWIAQMQEESRMYDAAKKLYLEAAELGADGGDDVIVARAWARIFFVLAHRDHHLEEAGALRRVGPTLLARARDDRARATWLSTEGLLLSHQGRYDEAVEKGKGAIALAEKAFGPEHALTALMRTNLGGIYREKGENALAREQSERVLATFAAGLGHEHPFVALAMNNVATDIEALGDPRRGIEILDEAHGILERGFGAESMNVTVALENLANCHYDVGEWEEARAIAEKVLRIREAALGPDHALVAKICHNLGNILVELRSFDRAIALHERATGINMKLVGEAHPSNARFLSALALAEAHAGHPDRALAIVDRANALLAKDPSGGDPYTRHDLLAAQGEAELARGRPADAVPLLEGALLLDNPLFMAETELPLAESLWASAKDRTRARELVSDARARYAKHGHAPGLERTTRWLREHAL